jgi:RimJ/RimL family protein N-acetyltransferase
MDDLAAQLRLPDGTVARVRLVVETDRQVLQDLYATLSQASRHGRFQAAPPRLTEKTLDHLVDGVDQIDHVAVLLLAPAGHPNEAPVGVGRIIRYSHDRTTADIAIAVADDWQNRGVGSALARTLIERRPAGITHLHTIVAADNLASLATLAGLGTLDRVLTANGLYDVTVTLTL